MGEQCGIGRSFHCVEARGETAMLRAYQFETWETPIREEVAKLDRWKTASLQHDTYFMGEVVPTILSTWASSKSRGDGQDRYNAAQHQREYLLGSGPRHGRGKTLGESADLQGYLRRWEYTIDHKLAR